MPRLPDDTRIYAIGDVHGERRLLENLLEQIKDDAGIRKPAATQRLIFLGDYVDRGPDTCGVVERLLSGLPAGFQHEFLMGNHERMLLDVLADAEKLSLWLYNGGEQALASYGLTPRMLRNLGRGREAARAIDDAIGARHLEFYRGLRFSTCHGGYFFTHAGVRPGITLDAQKPSDLIWIREPFLSFTGTLEKIVVHGHTPVPVPAVRPHRIGIDTGAFQTGRLTAVRLEGDEVAFLTATG